MLIKLVFLIWVIFKLLEDFGIIYKVRFEKIYLKLNAARCQTANSTESVRTSKKPKFSDDKI